MWQGGFPEILLDKSNYAAVLDMPERSGDMAKFTYQDNIPR